MERAWAESHPKCPLICLLSPGADPTKLIEVSLTCLTLLVTQCFLEAENTCFPDFRSAGKLLLSQRAKSKLTLHLLLAGERHLCMT